MSIRSAHDTWTNESTGSSTALSWKKRYLLLTGLLLANTLAQSTELLDPTLPMTIRARSIVLDRPENTALYRNVRFQNGDVSIEAKEAIARGSEVENSYWTFTGDVHIRLSNGIIDADSALVTIEASQVSHARIVGSPARFAQRRSETDPPRHGHAHSIEYDAPSSTVRLDGQVWIADGANEISSETLVYEVDGKRLLAYPTGNEESVNITIRPRTKVRADQKPE